MNKIYSVTLNSPFNNYRVLGEFDTEEEALKCIYTFSPNDLEGGFRDEVTFPNMGRITIWETRENAVV